MNILDKNKKRIGKGIYLKMSTESMSVVHAW